MEVVHILPTAVAIIPCPFHNDIKDIILSEVKEQEESMIEFNEKNDNLKHIQHYPVLENDLKTKNSEFNQNDVIYAKEGELVLFPSHTTHGYRENKGDNRVTISMNIMPTVVTNGDYGWRVTNLTPKERLDAFIISKDFDA